MSCQQEQSSLELQVNTSKPIRGVWGSDYMSNLMVAFGRDCGSYGLFCGEKGKDFGTEF